MLENQFRGRNDRDDIGKQFLDQRRIGLDGIEQPLGRCDGLLDDGLIRFGKPLHSQCDLDAKVHQETTFCRMALACGAAGMLGSAATVAVAAIRAVWASLAAGLAGPVAVAAREAPCAAGLALLDAK